MGLWCIECNNVNVEEFDKDNKVCKKCGSNRIVITSGDMTFGEMFVLEDISKDTSFIQAMIDLRDKDPIEYQLKMSQFKTNLAQQKVEEQKADNSPHCPVCNSTSLSKITTTKKVTKIAAFGIFGMGDNGKTWKCNNCGSKF